MATVTPLGLAWECTCTTKRRDIFCKHCVAAALAAFKNAPAHRRREGIGG